MKFAAETVVTLTPFYTRLKAVQARTSVKRVIASSIKEYLPALLKVLFTLLKEKKEGHRIQVAPGEVWLQDLLRRHARSPRPRIAVRPDDPVAGDQEGDCVRRARPGDGAGGYVGCVSVAAHVRLHSCDGLDHAAGAQRAAIRSLRPNFYWPD